MAILAHRKDELSFSTNEEDRKSNIADLQLRDAAATAYHSLVMYGSSVDLSATTSAEDDSNDTAVLSDTRRSRLLDIGRNLWMSIRNNPELFSGTISQDKANDGSDFASFEDKESSKPEEPLFCALGHMQLDPPLQ